MKNLLIILVILVVVCIGVWYFALKGPATNTNLHNVGSVSTTTFVLSTTTAPSMEQKTVTIDIKNFAFAPSSVTVAAGTKVIWVNDDSASHTVTSTSGNTLNSSLLSKGQSYAVTLDAPGTYNYYCKIHPMMKGTIIVQ